MSISRAKGLIPDVSAANITLRREQPVTRELRFEKSWSRGCGQQKLLDPSRDTNHEITALKLLAAELFF